MRKVIMGFENYQADSEGFIVKPARIAKDKRNGLYTKEIILKEHLTVNGYHQIQLWKEGKVVNKLVHVLVWETFHNQVKPSNLDIDHIDGNKDNNKLDNLELVNRKENMRRAVNLRLLPHITKDENIEFCIDLVRKGYSMTTAASLTKVSRDTLKRIRRGEGIHAKYKDLLDEAVNKSKGQYRGNYKN